MTDFPYDYRHTLHDEDCPRSETRDWCTCDGLVDPDECPECNPVGSAKVQFQLGYLQDNGRYWWTKPVHLHLASREQLVAKWKASGDYERLNTVETLDGIERQAFGSNNTLQRFVWCDPDCELHA